MKLKVMTALAAVLLAACESEPAMKTTAAPADMVASEAAFAPDARVAGQVSAVDEEQNAPKIAYSHRMTIEMPASEVPARFQKARDACLSGGLKGCILVGATISNADETTGSAPYASLTVRLPHALVGEFEASLVAALAEGGKPALVRYRATDAEDLTFVIADTDRRLAQAEDYRARLMALAERRDASVEDLIRIEAEISQVQSQIEALTAQKRGLNQRIETELFSVDFQAAASLGTVRSPLAEAWRNAGRTLGESAAAAFTFLIVTIPWLPIIALLVWAAFRLWRIVLGRISSRAKAA